METNLWRILNWAKTEGPVKAVERISMMVLADAMKEQISLRTIDPNTSCSPRLEKAVRTAAETVVGRPCPV